MAHGSTGCGAKQGYHSPDAHVPPKTTNLLEFFRTIQSIYIQFLRIHCMSYAAPTRYLAEKAKGFSKHSLLAYLEHEREETDELYRTLQQQSITFYTTIKGIGNVHAGIKVTGGCLGSASLRARSSTWMRRPQTLLLPLALLLRVYKHDCFPWLSRVWCPCPCINLWRLSITQSLK